MKIILDESTPQKLRMLIDGSHTVITTWFQGWSGLKMPLLVLSTNNWGLVKANIAGIRDAIDAATPGSFVFVDIGHAPG